MLLPEWQKCLRHGDMLVPGEGEREKEHRNTRLIDQLVDFKDWLWELLKKRGVGL